ncbi:MAG: hypothetical protein ABSD79_00855 [Dehalococcoidales bacterium]
MSPRSTLPITAANGQPLPNRFLRQKQAANRLALVLPGINYNVDMPMIYYTTQVLQFYGADVLQLRPDYQEPAFQNAPVEGRLSWMAHDTRAGLAAGLAAGSYQQVILAGKSIGTLSMALLLAQSAGLDPAVTIWLTPLLHDSLVVKAAQEHAGPSFFMAGSGDKTFDPHVMQRIKDRVAVQVWIAEGADHSLEIPGDPLQSLKILLAGMQALSTFLAEVL